MTLETLDRAPADLVFWPETAIPARIDQVEPFLAGLKGAMQSRNAELVTGIIDGVRVGSGGLYYNAAITTTEPRQEYRKRRLLPFTEYLPSFMPERWRKARVEDATGILSPGAEDAGDLLLGGHRVAVSICWETTYASLVHASAPDAQLLLTLTNDDWFRATIMPGQALQIARARAIEAGLDLVRASNSGISAVIDHRGRVEVRGPELAQTVVRGDIRFREGATPYSRLGDWLLLFTTTAAVGVAWLFAQRRRPPM
jgi:apolipoprotein N-acyltransferase